MPLRSIVVFLWMIVLSGAAQATTILIWGDSLSAGYGLQAREDWPTLLQTRLQGEGFRHTVVNGSISGETSSGGRSRLADALARHKPELVILALGANDGLRGLQPQLVRDNLAAMVQAARAAGARVLLVGMRLPPNYGEAYTRRFYESYTEVAREHKVALVPFLLDGFAAQRDMFQSDGIHPTAEAQKLMLETVWNHLLPLLNG